MFRLTLALRWLVVALAIGLPSGALAAPVSYHLTTGQITSVQFFDASGAVAPCPIGSTVNCLVNAPVAIDAGSITLDIAGPDLIAMNLSVSGPAILDMQGAFGISTVELTNLDFATTGTSSLTALGSGAFSFGPATGTLTTDLTINPLTGSSTFLAGASLTSSPSGTLFLDPTGAFVNLVGVELGQFCANGTCLTMKADFSFTAAIPEPGAFMAFGIGILLVAASQRRVRRERMT